MKINKKLILLSTISISLLATGCSSKSIKVNSSEVIPYNAVQLKTVQLEQVERKTAFLSVPKLETTTPIISSWEKKLSSNTSTVNDCADNKCVASTINPQSSSKSDVVVGDESMTPADDPYFASNVTVQVGAFRKFLGAKNYAKRYALLDNQYSVDIEKEMKDLEPIYRVQVNGFLSNIEAENFINKYGSQGAFLVRK